MKTPLFPLGRLVATFGALGAMDVLDMEVALKAHERGEWGDVGAEDAALNDASVHGGERIFSVYYTAQGIKFWIITEADRSVTTVLLPEEY